MGQRWRLRFKTKARLTCHRGSLGRILVQPDSPCPTPLSIRLRLEIPWGRRQTEEARVRYWQGGLVPWVCPEPSHGSWGDWGRPAIPLPTKYFLSTYCWLTTLLGPVRSAGKRTEKKRSFPHAAFIQEDFCLFPRWSLEKWVTFRIPPPVFTSCQWPKMAAAEQWCREAGLGTGPLGQSFGDPDHMRQGWVSTQQCLKAAESAERERGRRERASPVGQRGCHRHSLIPYTRTVLLRYQWTLAERDVDN